MRNARIEERKQKQKPRSGGELQAIRNGILNQRSKAIEERTGSRAVGNQISRIWCLVLEPKGRKEELKFLFR